MLWYGCSEVACLRKVLSQHSLSASCPILLCMMFRADHDLTWRYREEVRDVEIVTLLYLRLVLAMAVGTLVKPVPVMLT